MKTLLKFSIIPDTMVNVYCCFQEDPNSQYLIHFSDFREYSIIKSNSHLPLVARKQFFTTKGFLGTFVQNIVESIPFSKTSVFLYDQLVDKGKIKYCNVKCCFTNKIFHYFEEFQQDVIPNSEKLRLQKCLEIYNNDQMDEVTVKNCLRSFFQSCHVYIDIKRNDVHFKYSKKDFLDLTFGWNSLIPLKIYIYSDEKE